MKRNLLLVNDDGIGAPGLEALARSAEGLGKPLIVAPEEEFSGCGHQLTTRTPIAVRQLDESSFAVDGTPADCTRIAVLELCRDVSLVLAGINAGGNLGVDVYTSGTVAAAREAAILGIPAIAVSQYRRREIPLDWERATRWARRALEEVLRRPDLVPAEGPPLIWNINLPCPPPGAPDPGVIHCDLDPSPLAVGFHPHDGAPAGATDTRSFLFAGAYDQRPRIPGRDVDVCFGGSIAITALRVD